jgi:Domain of unknown function (DUF4919)
MRIAIASPFRPTIVSLLCLVAFTTPSRSATEPAPEQQASYSDLVARARSGPADVDYLALRNAYAEDPSYNPYGGKVSSFVVDMNKAFRDGDCAAALVQAQNVIELAFVNIEAHFVAGVCHQRAGDLEAARREITMARGLYASILKSGDGKSPETAYHVVTVAEEYSVLRGLGLTKEIQALQNKDGHAYDVLGAKSADGSTSVTLYFNIDRPMAALGRTLQQGRR